ncbi:protocadherin Fat 4 isoform X5 [Nematostella vectensis]|uniref:protocadherin Fat 4 isoform X5 n=1 Tax=Nematostella vectensis TaxID=45351 RepID=UPI0020779032|nr:protocadherin Fat 4 isoform X5 [Nematostella vectensis]
MAARMGTVFRMLLLLGSLIHLANGARPLFDPPYWTTVLPEVNTTAGTNITRFTATDADGDNISYSLQSNAHPWFRINNTTGDLIVNKTLDREEMGAGDGSFRFEVYASDGSSPQGKLTAILTITDINDNAPAFQNTPLTVSCSENRPIGLTVATLTATDADATTNAIITFVIVSGNEGEAFSIDKVTGDITISKPLDYENGPRVYTLNISAMNNHTDLMLQSFGVVTINITDVDDLPANFSQKLYEAHIDKNSPLGSLITQVHAKDMDSLNAPVEYSIYPDSDPGGLFAINKTSGEVTVDGNLRNGVYSLIVNAKSTTQPLAFTLVKVTVSTLSNLTYDVSILEGEANVQVMDLKPAESHFNVSGGNFTFFSSSGSMFSINGTNLRVGSTPLDRETAAQHVLDISLTEGGTIKGFVKVTVNILDINDETPLFQSPSFNVSVNEIERLGTVFLTVSATDGDAGANSALTYSIAAGNEEGFFSINNKTGAISVAKQLDRETRDQYTLTVMAQDGGEPPLNSTTAVAIQVGDANDNPPVIQDAVIQVSLSETAAIDTPVATVIASDKDIGANGRLMYSIENGAHGHFQIKDSSSGAISLAGMLSYNQRNNYIVVVNVTDGGSPALKSRAMVVIDVTPKPRNLTYDVSVLEGEANVQVMDLKPAESHFNVSGGNFTFFDSSGSMFSINGTNLRVGSTPLDRETAAQHILDISLTEGGTIKGFVKVTVNVLDINDETPLFQSPFFNVSVNEIERLGTVFLTVSATDGDAGANSALTYSIAAGNEEGVFSINNKTGAISVAKQLDRETRDQYTLTVMAQDGGEPPLNSTTAVVIQVGDANDNPPVIQDAVIQVSLSETAAIDTPVATVIASDKDIGANGRLMYSIESGAHGHFQIKDSSSGAISLAGMLSYNQRNNYIVVVNVTDGGSPALKSRAMVVIDVTPKPRNLTYDVSVMEGEANVQVMDLKPAESHFNVSGGNFTFFDSSGSMFSINGTNLRVGSTPLDRETAAQHVLDISLTEGGTIKGFVKVTINVLDINDETPLFQSPSFNVSVNEIERLGTVFLTVSATDGDAGANSALTYSIAAGNEEGFFSINNKTGAISVAKQLDRETRDQYTLTVMAQDGGEPPLNSTTAVAIQVGDANDNPPVIQDAVIQVSLSETAAIDTPVATVIASDKDIGANGRLMYSIESGAHGHFQIKDSSSGAISLAGMLSYNQRNNYIVVVNVTDGGSPALKSRAMVVIDVTPKPRNLTYDVSVLEGEANVQVMDLKPAESHFNVSGGNFTFFDSSGSMFSINGTNLRVGSTPLDRETAAQHVLDISLTEGGTIKGFVKVTVNVLDINDETPLFQSPSFNVSVNEIERLGTVFLTVSATDGDAGSNSALTYSIAAGNEEGFFSINNKTGAISVAKQLDRETRDQYTLTVMAQDGGEPPLNSTTAVAIQVGDANDNPPVIQDAVIQVSLSETAAIDTPVATVIASDKDIGANGRLMYSIESGAHGHFQIKDSSSGAISLAGMLSYNQRNNYIVVVNVTDGGSPALKSRAMVVIDVTPKPRNLTYDVSVLEGEANVQVMDLKPAESHFNVSGGNFTFFDSSGSMFSINGTNLRVGSTPLDRETAAQHVLDISLTEGGTIKGFVKVTVNVLDINDETPLFQSPSFNVSVNEIERLGTVFLTVSATDGDAGSNSALTYSIAAGNEEGFFSINNKTGAISVAKQLDRETRDQYTLTVMAQDGGEPPLNSTTAVAIQVGDANDNPPVIQDAVIQVSLSETAAIDTPVATVIASDKDIGANGRLMYSIESGAHGHFQIKDSSSGAISLAGMLSYNQRNNYIVVVNVTDGGSPALKSRAMVVIDVTPKPRNLTYDVSVLEGEANVQVMDLKPAESHFNVSGGNFTFFDSSGSMFSINGTNLRVGSTPLDRETAAQHVLDISLTEGGTIKGFVKVTVNVLDINDETPLFQSPSFNVSVNEIERLGTVFLTVSATDGDAGSNSALTYSIAAGNEEGFFSINNKTGAISVAKQLDRETRDQYTLTVMAQDGGEPPLNSTTAVAIQVGDANDNPPVIQDAVIQVSLSETAATDTPVATVIASDKDIGANGRLMYSIESGAHGHFQIKDSSSGAISLAGMLSYNQRNNYIVVVNVTDGGSPALKSRAMVVIDVTPKPRNLTYDVSVLEGEANVQVMDLKPAESHFNVSGGNFTFFDSSGSMFSINGTNLRVGSTPLDRETAAQHVLDISLTEGGTIKGFVKVTVNVLDINDETPLFQSPSFNVSVNEIERLGTVFLTVLATDGDAGANSALTYSIAAGNEEGFFSINNKTGAISVAKQLDRETRDQYTLTVMAQDGGEPPLNSTTAVAIQVGDANDNPPVIQDAVIQVSLSETAAIDTPVATVIASDKDIGANGRLMYSIESGAHGQFQIKDSSSGAINLAGMLSYNQRNNYIVVVNVTDGGSPALKSRAMVVIDVTPKPRNLTYDVSVLEGEANVQVMDLKPAESHFNVSGGNFTFFDSSGSMFSINGTNLRVGSTPLDRETAAQHILDISLTEGGTIKGFVKVTVNVLDINDETPLFQSPSFNVSVNEIERLGTVFLTVSATDGDAGANSALTYSIAAGNEEGFFSINNKTGAISVAKQLDRETRDQYTLTVMAQDGGEPPLNSTTAVAIQVGDANDNPPVIQDAVIRVSLSETAAIDTPVATVIASDKDIVANGRLMYSIESGAHGQFQIKDSSSGAINLAGMLSYNQRNNYIVVVNVTDGGSPALKSRAMVVIDVTPKPRNLTYDVSVLEGEANVQVMDLKPAESHFNVSGGNFTFFDSSGSMFSINGTNLRVGSTPLDRETAAQHILDISLTEGGTIKGFVKVTVNVLDINDETPLFQSPSFNVSVNEIERLGTVFLTVSATDGDAGANSALTYSIAAGNEEGFFSINNKTGAISVAKQLDRETRDQYTLTVMAQDGGEPPLNSTTAVAIQVDDANDNPPVIQDAVIRVSLSETAAIDTPVATMIASDKDIGANGRLMYSIESGAHGQFQIKDSSSGAISLDGMLSYNQRNNYIVVVNVTDGGSPALKSRAMVVIDVTPKPRNLTYNVSVLEGEANVQVMDLKPAESHFNASGGTFAFFGSSGSMFFINGTNLRVGSTPLDRETAEEHVLDISLTEGGIVKGLFKVTVNVLDINDETPSFQSPYFNVSVNEIERLGTVFLTVSATDGDAGANSALTYSIAAGNEEGFFSINNKTSAISVAKQLDRETRDLYMLTVMAQDGGEPSLNRTAAVAIQVGDANDNPPVIQDAVIQVSLSETAEIDTPVATVIASDKDIGANGRLMYSIESGAHGHFRIKDSSSGAISLAGMLSYNQRNNYIVVVNVTDGGSPALKSRAIVVIDVTPKPRNLTYDVSVLEGEANVQVMDLKPAESHFNVSRGNFTFFDSSGSMFSINGTNLRVGSTPLDRETAAQHILDISLTEGGTIKGFVKVTVNVLDINDETPLFQSPSFNVSVNEIERLGTVFLTVSATDGDAGANSALTYSIAAGNEEGFFSINNKTGAISVAKQLDRETRDQYTLTVMAQDGSEPPLNSTTAVAIQVGDANDNPPVIQDAVIQVSLTETAAIDTPVATVIASDKDIGANGRLMYSIESGAHGHFQIKDSSSGAISVAGVLSYKQRHNYTVVVKVTDGGSLALESRAIVLIDVTSTTENRNGPVFASVQYIGGVYKDTSFDFPVLTVTATDSDTGVNGVVEYRIREVTDLFYVEPISGTIRTADVFADKDEGQSFSFSVQASDKGTPPKETKEKAQVTIFLLRGSNSMVLTSNMSKDDILLRRPEFLEDIKELNGGGHVIIKSIRPREGNTSIITINGIKNLQEMSYNQLFDAFKASEGSPKYVKWQLTGQGEPPVTSARTADEEELSPVVIALIFLSVLVGVAGIAMILILCKKRRDERLPRKHSRVTFNDKPLYIDPVSSSGGGRADPAQEAQEVIVHMDEETSSNGSNDTHVPVDPTVLNYINNAYANSNNESDTDSETYINPDTGEITHFATFFPPPPPNVPPPPIPESDEESNGDLGTENTYMPSDQFDVDYEVFSPAPIGNRAVSPTHSTADSTAQLVDPTTFRETILHDQYFAFNGRLPSNQDKTTEL